MSSQGITVSSIHPAVASPAPLHTDEPLVAVDAAFSSPPRQFLSAPSDASSNGLTRPIRPSAADADSSVVDLEQEIERLADELEKKRFELGKVMKQESSGQRAVDAKVDEEMSGETEQPVSTSSIPGDNDSTRRRTLSPLLAPSDTATTPPPGTVRPPSTAAAHATATNDLSSLTGLPIESSNSSALSRWAGTSAYDSWSNRDDIGEYVAPREQYSKPKFVAQDHEYNELEVVAHLEHLEATVVAKDEEVVLVRSRLKQVENDWDEALFAKKMVEDELAEVKVRAAKKVARIEEKMAKRVGEKEREIEELKYRLAGGFGASGATGGGEDVGASFSRRPSQPLLAAFALCPLRYFVLTPPNRRSSLRQRLLLLLRSPRQRR